ncbi:MAG: GGDEF domain-containing protein [Selenomonadaceae bacterium]|nr:GGDEF domain-containing protein [Selenomonadaceae bacterium]
MKELDNAHLVRNPLSKTMTVYCVLFAALFAITMGVGSFLVYERDMLHRYHAYTADVLNYVARTIDGDDLLRCMHTGVKSEKYRALQKLANDVKETHKLEFLYIIQPISDLPPDNMMDVLAAYTQAGKEAGTDGLTDLGQFTGDAYPPEVARQYLSRMDRDPEVTFFPNDTEFGNIYTAIRPVFDSRGEPIAVLCADVLIDEINDGRKRFIGMSLLVGVVVGTLLVAVMSWWLKRRVAHPIAKIRHSAISFAVRSHGNRDLEALTFDDPQIHTRDELEDLSLALSSMCNDMKAYTEELIAADRQVGELRDKVELMDELAYRDALTGARNKASYEKHLARCDWDILAGKADFAIVMCDLNYLKRINDSLGHGAGDAYINNLYEILQKFFPHSMSFRIGGDEFAVIVKAPHSDTVAEQVAAMREYMRTQLGNTDLEPWERVSAAVGYCRYDKERHKEAKDVFKEADADMYRVKKAMHAGRE